MFGSQIFDVAIGMIFVYLLLSLICSVLNEWVAGILSLRATNLEVGIRNLLKGDLTNKLYNHGLIKGLFKQDWIDKLRGKQGVPSYIPSRTFALALLDTIAPADANKSQTIEDLRKAVGDLPVGEVRTALLALINDAQGDIETARQNVERWYNDTMDRVAGWYKRKTQIIILIFALVVSAVLNADSIVIVNSLIRDPALRASVATAAQEYVKNNNNNSSNANSATPLERTEQLG